MRLDNIPILKYQQIHNAIKTSGDNEVRQWYNVISILEDKPVDHYKAMLYDDFKKLISQYQFVISDQMPDEWVKSFTCQGEEFIVVQRTDEWTTEQFISLQNLTKDPDKIIDNLHQILAVLCLKHKGELVSVDEHNRRAEMFQDHLSCTIAYPIAFFYYAVLAALSNHTRSYSTGRKAKTANKHKNQTGFRQSGDGMQQ